MTAAYATLGRVMSGDAPALPPQDLVAATGGTLLRHSDRPIRGGAVDSRLVEPGQLFVALAGERTDGHRFLAHAAARRAPRPCSSAGCRTPTRARRPSTRWAT